MPKRITTHELAQELNSLKCDNAAQHRAVEEKIILLQLEAREAKLYFESKFDKLDNRIWAIVLLTIGSMFASILSMLTT